MPIQFAAELERFKSEKGVLEAKLALFILMSEFESVRDKLEATEHRLREADTFTIQLRDKITSLEVELLQTKRKLARSEDDMNATRKRPRTASAAVAASFMGTHFSETLDRNPKLTDGLNILAPVVEECSQSEVPPEEEMSDAEFESKEDDDSSREHTPNTALKPVPARIPLQFCAYSAEDSANFMANLNRRRKGRY